MWQDIRTALRSLARTPGFTFIVLAVLALGIGANTAIFSIINAVLLQPLPFDGSDRIVLIWSKLERVVPDPLPATPAAIEQWRTESNSFEHIVAFDRWRATWTGAGEPEQIRGSRSSASLFEMLRAKPALGRTFLPDEDQAGNDKVLLLSYRLWQRRFGGDPEVLGRSVTLDGEGFRVIGIMPSDFRFPTAEFEFWAPLVLDPARAGDTYLTVFARLKPNISPEQAQTELHTINDRAPEGSPDEFLRERRVEIVPIQEEFVKETRLPLLVLSGAVAFVLLIACANIANLTLGRAAARSKEIAIRTALGAGRKQIMRGLLAESVLLVVMGASIGLLLASWAVTIIQTAIPPTLAFPSLERATLDAPVLAFTIVVSMLTVLLVGAAPALQASSRNLQERLNEASRGSTGGRARNRFRSALVVSQTALALMLMAAAGLMLQSFVRLMDISPGFEARNVLTLRLQLPEGAYGEDIRVTTLVEQFLRQIQTLPGVADAGAIDYLPLSGSWNAATFSIDGRSTPGTQQLPTAIYGTISPRYFATMGIPLESGRYFTDQDRAGTANVVILSRTMASQFWAGEDPVGKSISVEDNRLQSRFTIVGVVADVRHEALDAGPKAFMYVPSLQNASRDVSIVIRTATDPASLTSAVRTELGSLDPNLSAFDVQAMEQRVSDSVFQPHLQTLLLGVFAAVALLLAVLGLYGVMAFIVSQRIREIGIRIALGAQRLDIFGLVIGQGFKLSLIGIAFGLVLSAVLTRFLAGLLFEISPTDELTLAAVSFLLLVVSLTACYVPARRATRVDPMTALRHE